MIDTLFAAKQRAATAKLRAKYKAAGKCYCGRDPEEGYRQCYVCRHQRTPEQDAARLRDYRKRNLHRIVGKNGMARRQRLRAVYGLSPEKYDSMLASQNMVCDACAGPSSDPRGFFVDHNHDTGKVRGLLCGKCNSALGLADDSIEKLEALIAYLKRYD